MKFYASLAGAALVLAACGGGPEAPPPLAVSDVQVTTDLTAVTSQTAAQYWGNVESDLESAIAAQFVGETAPGGVGIAVDIDEISMASFLDAGADAQLVGNVAVLDPLNGEQIGFYNVSASASQAATLLGSADGVVTVAPTSQEFYGAVVQAFARGVAQAVRAGGMPAPS